MSTPADDLRAALNLPPETKFPDVIAAIYALRKERDELDACVDRLTDNLDRYWKAHGALPTAPPGVVDHGVFLPLVDAKVVESIASLPKAPAFGNVDDEVTPKVSPPDGFILVGEETTLPPVTRVEPKATERVEMPIPPPAPPPRSGYPGSFKDGGLSPRGYPDGDSSGND